jgi:hypothetical protein
MRCIDDSMIYHFVEKYKGNAVNVDTIIEFLITSVGSNPADAPIGGEEVRPHMRHKAGWVPVTGPFSPKPLVDRLVAATPGFQPEVGMSLGARLNMNPDPQATFALDDQDINVLHDGLSKYGQWGLRAGTANHKPLSRSQGWGAKAASNKSGHKPPFGGRGTTAQYTIGSGFRGPSPPRRKHGLDEESLDDSLNSFSESYMSQSQFGVGGNYMPARNPLSSPPMGYLSDMARTFPHDAPDDIFRVGLVGANDEEKEVDPQVAIDHVEGQLVEEGNLPSSMPIRALSDKQITMIGEGDETFEAIANSMDMAKKFNMRVIGAEADVESVGSGTFRGSRRLSNLGDIKASDSVSVSSRERRLTTGGQGGPKAVPPPRMIPKAKHGIGTRIETLSGNTAPLALMTTDVALKKGPRMPYALGDELGKIMCSGIASGAGLPLNNVRPNTSAGTIGHAKGILRAMQRAKQTKKKAPASDPFQN